MNAAPPPYFLFIVWPHLQMRTHPEIILRTQAYKMELNLNTMRESMRPTGPPTHQHEAPSLLSGNCSAYKWIPVLCARSCNIWPQSGSYASPPPPSGDPALHLGFTALRPLRALLGVTECVSSGRKGGSGRSVRASFVPGDRSADCHWLSVGRGYTVVNPPPPSSECVF